MKKFSAFAVLLLGAVWAQAAMAQAVICGGSTLNSGQPQDATAWQLLAQASQAQGQQLRALRAEAEAQVAMLDYSAALDRLRAAQALARQPGADHFEASIIDTRARQLESTVREQALER